MRERNDLLLTALTPMLWGTTYITTELLPADRPLLAGAVRALPAGLLLIAAVATLSGRAALPRGAWWWRAAVLGVLNIGLFFALLFVAAYRLPGGMAALPGTLGPFIVAALAIPLLGERPGRRALAAAAIGVVGVAVMVGGSADSLDGLGLVAAFTAVVSMAVGGVLGRRWGAPQSVGGPTRALVALTGWQLTFGGLALAPVALIAEGLPDHLSGRNVAGFAYLALATTALAYFLWFRGTTRLPAVQLSLLARLSPVVAAIVGWVVLGQSLSPTQLVGAAIVLAGVGLGVSSPAVPAPAPRLEPQDA